MQISSVNGYSSKYYSPIFGINLNSPKLRFREEDFFVRIKGYGKNAPWAEKIKETADSAVTFIRKFCNFDETLKRITNGVTEANQISTDIEKQSHTGIIREKRKGWRYGSSWHHLGLITKYDTIKRYHSYSDRFDYIVQHPLKNPFKDISLTRPIRDRDFGKFLDHGNAKYVNKALAHVNELFDKIHTKYIKNEITKDSLPDVNSMIAEIRWIMAHATPWERGSDAISNTFIRAIYKAIGIKTFPLKKGVSLDLEAYCTNLSDYKKNFSSYFSKEPKIVE